MRLLHRAPGSPRTIAVLPGAFNPPTIAHLALIEAAAPRVDQVLCVIPNTFPHKTFHGASLEDRIRMLHAAQPVTLSVSIGVSEGGLFLEIARECRETFDPTVELAFLCGRDAAERILQWDYGDPAIPPNLLRHFSLLVAARKGSFHPPPELAHHVSELTLAPGLDEISSSEVRRRVRDREPWEHLVPAPVRPLVRQIYR